MQTWLLIVLSSSVFYLCEHYYKWIKVEQIHLSSYHLKQGKWWVFITATFSHDGLSHILNNMIMFIAYAREMEARIGSGWLLFIYLLTAIGGWMMTLRYNRHRFGPTSCDYIWSCGSSPATYGTLFALCMIAPYLPVAGSKSSSSFFSFLDRPWIWFYLVAFLPAYLHPHCKYRPFFSPAFLHISVPILLLIGLAWVRPKLASMTALQWLYLYYIKTGLFRAYDVLVLGAKLNVPAADGAAHLGGALTGLALGPIYLTLSHASSSFLSWKWLLFADEHQFLILAVAVAFLSFRLATDF